MKSAKIFNFFTCSGEFPGYVYRGKIYGKVKMNISKQMKQKEKKELGRGRKMLTRSCRIEGVRIQIKIFVTMYLCTKTPARRKEEKFSV